MYIKLYINIWLYQLNHKKKSPISYPKQHCENLNGLHPGLTVRLRASPVVVATFSTNTWASSWRVFEMMSMGWRILDGLRKIVSNSKGRTQPISSQSSRNHLISRIPKGTSITCTTSVVSAITSTSPHDEEFMDMLPNSSSWYWQKQRLSSSTIMLSIASTMWAGIWSCRTGFIKSHIFTARV